jgi:hypothetical protein
MSPSAIELKRQCMKRGGFDRVAAELEMSAVALRDASAGKSLPRSMTRRLLEAKLGVPADGWGVGTGTGKTKAHAPSAKPVPAGELPDIGTTEEELLTLARRLKRCSDDVENNPESTAEARDRIHGRLLNVLARLAKVRGEGEMSESQVARSPYFVRLLERGVEALKPYPPALDAFVEAMSVP